jgi:hypothetical protein
MTSLVLIVTATTATIASSIAHDNATYASDQATSALEQTLKDMQPLTVEKNGVQSLNPDPPNSLLPNIESAQKSADQFSKYAAEQRRDNIEYLAAQYGGQIILAIGSAFIGALAGWLIIPMLVERRSSRRND